MQRTVAVLRPEQTFHVKPMGCPSRLLRRSGAAE